MVVKKLEKEGDVKVRSYVQKHRIETKLINKKYNITVRTHYVNGKVKSVDIDNKFKHDEMIVEEKINVMSLCEHHFVTIYGTATVGYIPNEHVLGLSKMNRIVEYFSKRPQVQERLTNQIYATLCYILETDNVAVVIDAKHFCVASRGVEDVNSNTVTSKLGGAFKVDPATRAEFMALTRR